MGIYQKISLDDNECEALASLEKKLGPFEIVDKIPRNSNTFLSLVIENDHVRRIGIGSHIFLEFPKEIIQFKYLTSLYLPSNNLQHLPKFLEKLEFLRFLDLKMSDLTEMPESLQYFIHLQVLSLRFNKIEIIPSWIKNLKELIVLDLMDNRINQISPEIGNLTKLTKFGLSMDFTYSFNLPIHLNPLPESFRSLHNIMHLTVVGYLLSEIPDQIKDLKNLQILNLSLNRILIIPSWIGELDNLKMLFLSKNDIRQLPDEFKHIQKMEELFIDGNSKIKLPDSLPELPLLTKLILSRCEFDQIPPIILKCQRLQVLDLSENNLNDVPESIQNLVKLKDLNLNNNYFQNIPLSLNQLQSLETLDLSHNKIMNVPESLLCCPKLKKINLNHNLIEKISDAMKTQDKIQIDWNRQKPTQFTRYKQVLDTEKLFDPNKIKQTLLIASLYLTAYEILDEVIIETVQNFFEKAYLSEFFFQNNEYSEKPSILKIDRMGMMVILRDEYLTEVANESNKRHSGSIQWLVKNQFISEQDKKEIKQIYGHRSKIAHQLANFLTNSDFEINIKHFQKIRYYIRKISWIIDKIEKEVQDEELDEDSFEGYRSGRESLLDIIIESIGLKDPKFFEIHP